MKAFDKFMRYFCLVAFPVGALIFYIGFLSALTVRAILCYLAYYSFRELTVRAFEAYQRERESK